MFGGRAFLRVEIDQQHQIRHFVLEGRLYSMVHFNVGMHFAFTLDRDPFGFAFAGPRAGCGGRVAQQTAFGSTLQVKASFSAMAEEVPVFAIEVVDGQHHTLIFALYGHCSSPPLPVFRHDHRRPGARVSPTEIGGQFRAFHLAAATFGIVMGVLAFAVRPNGAEIVHLTAQLAGVFNDHAHAMRIAFAEMASRGIVGPRPAEIDDA